jgi:DNA-binding IclR family transcriptional regulator
MQYNSGRFAHLLRMRSNSPRTDLVPMSCLKTGSPPAVDRALTIMEELARSKRGLRLSEIALRLGIPKSTTHALLVALERRGYLHRNQRTGRYLFGSRILTLANAALGGMTLREVAHPVLLGVMHETGLAAKMAILDQDQALLIDQVYPPYVSTPMTWLGRRLDLHCTALGKSLASSLPREQWQPLLTEHKLARHNDATICSPARLMKELTLTRERGYSLDNEEFDIGMRCLAVPVVSAAEETAAIGISGTTLEVDDTRLELLVRVLKTAAAKIAERFGDLAETDAAKEDGQEEQEPYVQSAASDSHIEVYRSALGPLGQH